MTEAPHVYRNYPEDNRTRDQLHYCSSCNGWYGVPHTNSHCQKGDTGWTPRDRAQCACRFCRESCGLSREGMFGFISDAPEWAPC